MPASFGNRKNYWVSYRDPLFQWKASLSYENIDASDLEWWRDQSLAVLADTGLYRVYSAPRIGFRSRNANVTELTEVLRKRRKELGELDLLFFSDESWVGNPTCAFSTSLTYYTPTGALRTEEFLDLASLQLLTQPWLNETEYSFYHRKALVISGVLFTPGNVRGNPVGGIINAATKEVSIFIRTHTDIWQPCVEGLNELDRDVSQIMAFDNTELAAINGQRLNAALSALKGLTIKAGGSWGIDEEYIGVKEYDENGVLI